MEVTTDEIFISESVGDIREALGYEDVPPPPPPEEAHPVLVSMAGGKIGSIYFSSGRIRMTHRSGPVAETERDDILRVNVNHTVAWGVFVESDAPRPTSDSREAWTTAYFSWLITQLSRRSLKTLPAWASLITTPESAPPEADSDALQSSGTSLFELYGKLTKRGISFKEAVLEPNDEYHPSRGAMVQREFLPSELSLLKDAIKIATSDTEYRKGELLKFRYKVRSEAELSKTQRAELKKALVAWKNQTFYQIVESELPDFAHAYLRTPEEVAT